MLLYIFWLIFIVDFLIDKVRCFYIEMFKYFLKMCEFIIVELFLELIILNEILDYLGIIYVNMRYGIWLSLYMVLRSRDNKYMYFIL